MGKSDKTEKENKKQKHFWKDFKAELKKVIWPTRSQVVNNTVVVLVIVVIVTAIVFVLDLTFEALNTYGINKLKTLVQNTVQNDTSSVTENEEETDENSTENQNTNTAEENDNTAEGAENTDENASNDENAVTDTENVTAENNQNENVSE